jgi:hypothetical protein
VNSHGGFFSVLEQDISYQLFDTSSTKEERYILVSPAVRSLMVDDLTNPTRSGQLQVQGRA